MLERHEVREREPSLVVQGDADTLWLWGRLQDFKAAGLLAAIVTVLAYPAEGV